MKVVIIGAGFGGLSVAKELAGKNGIDVVLVDRRNHHLFQPFLYQVATAGLSPADISMPVRSLFRRAKNVEVLLATMESVDLSGRKVRLDNGALLSYDKLVIAAGAKNRIFKDEWKPYVLGLKTLADALKLRKSVLMAFELAEAEPDPVKRDALLTFVVIGAGPTGVELAGAISELAKFSLAQDFRMINPKDAKIVLIEGGDRVLSTFHPALSIRAQRDLERLGINVVLGKRVSSILEGQVDLDSGKIHASTIIWAAGVTSENVALTLGKELKLDLQRGNTLPVNRRLEVLGAKDIYAIGDMAYFTDHPLPGVAQVAIQQGKYLGHLLRHLAKSKPYGDFRYVDRGQMATIGRRRAIAQIGKLRFGGVFAWWLWIFVHIYFLIGFRNRVSVIMQWIWSYVTYKKGARIIN